MRRRGSYMSPEWLREQQRQSQRVEFEGVSWRWPVRPQDSLGRVNRWLLRRQPARREEAA